MPLILSPKTTQKTVKTFREELGIRKVPYSQCRFWHGNFKDSFYRGLDGGVDVLFCGYSGAVAGQALFEYYRHYAHEQEDNRIFFIGSVYAFRYSQLDLGDICLVDEAWSPDSFEQFVYSNSIARGNKHFMSANFNLLFKALNVARYIEMPLKRTKTYCRISPAYYPGYEDPEEIMREEMWHRIANGEMMQGRKCDSGEYESAAVYASAKMLGMPALAIMDVKDKFFGPGDYRLADPKVMAGNVHKMLRLVKAII